MGLQTRPRRPTWMGRSLNIYSIMCHRLLFLMLFVLIVQPPFGFADGFKQRRKSKSNFLRQASVKGEDVACDESQIGKEVSMPGITGIVKRDPTSIIVCTCMKDKQDSQFKVICARKPNKCSQILQGCYYTEVTKPNSECPVKCKGCIASNGTRYESGESWIDQDVNGEKCEQNVCFSGVITTSKPACSPIWCSNPLPGKKIVNEIGTCNNGNAATCPSCAGCSKDGTIYSEGETRSESNDPCSRCTCSDGNLTCKREICPVLSCPEPLVKVPKGKCCPECVRKGSFAKQKGMCYFRGRVYRTGSTYNNSPCTECTCIGSQTTQCKRKTCPALNCPLWKQRIVSGACCAHCTNDIGLIEPGIKPTTTSKPSTNVDNKTCKVAGKEYGSNTRWKSGPGGCQQCVCVDGVTKCTAPSCNIATKDDCPLGAELDHPGGECCPKCKILPGKCTIFGDPHYKTFDGRIFNFQGSCKYLLSKECDKSGDNSINGLNSSFSVRITNDNRNSTGFSWTRTITVKLNEDKITLMQNRRDGQMRVKINGKRVDVTRAYIKLGYYSIIKEGYRLVLRSQEGISILWDGVSFLEMTVPPKYRNRLCGLCGNFNGDITDDFSGRHGKMYDTGMTFGNSWRVGGFRACSIQPQDMAVSFEPKHNCSQSWSSRIKSDRHCNAIHSTMFEKCAEKMATDKPEYYFNACKLDMCECPTNQCHCEVLTAYARECENLGLLVQGWRKATNCENVTSYRYGKRRNRKNGFYKTSMKNPSTNNILQPSENIDDHPSWLSGNTEPNDIGHALPAYSPKEVERSSSKRRFIDRAMDYKHLLTPKERKRIRNQDRRRKRKQLRRERKRRRRLDKKRRRQRNRKMKADALKQKRQERHQIELRRLNHEMGIDVVESKDENGEIKRMLNWGKSTTTRKRPPFEELLSGSFPGSSGSSNRETDLNDEDNNSEDYHEYDNLLEHNSAIIQDGYIPNNLNGSVLKSHDFTKVSNKEQNKESIDIQDRRGKTISSRTPLPLFDIEDDPYKQRSNSRRHSRSVGNSIISYYPPQSIYPHVSNYASSTSRKIQKGTKVHYN